MIASFSNEMIDLIPVLKETVRIREEPQGAVFMNVTEENISGKYILTSSFEAFILSHFDGTSTIQDIANLLKVLKDSPEERTVQRDIYSFIQQRSEYVELIKNPLKKGRIQEDPLKFLSKRNIFSEPIRPYKPLWVDLYVTRECNLKCIYCFADAKYVNNDNKREQSKNLCNRMNSLVDQIAELEIKRILLTGGEPTLMSYLPNIIDRLTNHKIEVVLATNAYLMNGKMAQNLRESGLQRVQVKLDAANQKIQDKLSGIGGSFMKLIEGIEILKKHSFKVSVASVATSLNIKEIPHVIKMCADLGVDKVSPRIYTSGIWALNGRGGAHLNPPPDSILWLEQKISELQEKYKGVIEILSVDSSVFNKKSENEVPKCPGFISSCAILDNGSVVPCELLADFSNDFIMGDTNKDTLIDIWNSKKVERWVLRKHIKIEEPCSSCDQFDRCKGGCPWKSYVAYGNWSVDPFCIKAPKPTKIPFPEISNTP